MGNLKGIIVEIGGDTSGLQKALQSVDKVTQSLTRELKGINTLLDFDPKNTILLAQKQEVLAETIKETSDRLNVLKSKQDEVYKKWQNYIKLKPQIEKVAESIKSNQEQLEKLKKAQEKAQEQFEKGKITEEQYNQINEEVKKCEESLKSLRKEQKELNETTVTTENYRNFQREIINTERNVKNLEKQLKDTQAQASKWTQASKALKNFSTTMGNVGSTITSVGQKFMGLTATIGAGVVAGIKYNAEMENLGTNLKVLLGNEKSAQNMLKTLKQMASTTPFETTDLVNATQTMLSFGVEAENVNDILNMLGDVSMGNKEKLSSLALVFGQISANGKLTGQDLLQLVNVGFNPLQIMSEQTGESMESLREKMSEGQITIEDVTEAFKVATSEGGRFYKGMEEGSQTLTGKASTAMDSFKEALGGLTETLLPVITDVLEKFTDLINEFNALDEESKKSIMNFALIAGAIAPVLIAVGSLFSAISKISMGISGLLGWIAKVKAGQSVISAGALLLTGKIALIIGAITALVAGIKYLWDNNEGFRTAVINVWNKIKETLVNIFTAIGEFFTVTIPQWIQNVQDWFANLPYNIGHAIGQLLGRIVQFGIDAWKWVTTELPKIIEGIIDWFKKLPSNIWTWLTETLKKIGQWIIDAKNMVIEKVPEIISKIASFFEELPSKMLEIGKNIVQGLWNGISNSINWIKEKVGQFAQGILDGMKDALGIHSPSTLFRDEVGRFMAEGIGVGFMKNLSGVVSSMKTALLDETGKLNTNIGLTGNLNGIDSKINSLGSTSTSNVINLTINPQRLTEAELDNVFNYMNRRFGMAL